MRNPSYICVASVAEKRDIFIKIHIDSESDHFDYWVRVDSPHIFPIGTCDAMSRELSVPLLVNWKSSISYFSFAIFFSIFYYYFISTSVSHFPLSPFLFFPLFRLFLFNSLPPLSLSLPLSLPSLPPSPQIGVHISMTWVWRLLRPMPSLLILYSTTATFRLCGSTRGCSRDSFSLSAPALRCSVTCDPPVCFTTYDPSVMNCVLTFGHFVSVVVGVLCREGDVGVKGSVVVIYCA